MKAPPSLERIRRHQRAEGKQLRSARVAIAVFRALFRCLEFFGSPERRQKRREFREKVRALKGEEKVLLHKVKNSTFSEGLNAIREMQTRHERPEDRAWFNEVWDRQRSVQQESEALRSIRKEAGEDHAAAARGYRDYIAAHPDGSLAHSYLGGVLQQSGDLDGSLSEYREAVRIAGSDSIRGASARLQIGEVLRQKGDVEAAVAEFQAILEEATPQTRSHVPMAFYYLGDTLSGAGRHREARSLEAGGPMGQHGRHRQAG